MIIGLGAPKGATEVDSGGVAPAIDTGYRIKQPARIEQLFVLHGHGRGHVIDSCDRKKGTRRASAMGGGLGRTTLPGVREDIGATIHPLRTRGIHDGALQQTCGGRRLRRDEVSSAASVCRCATTLGFQSSPAAAESMPVSPPISRFVRDFGPCSFQGAYSAVRGVVRKRRRR